MDNLQLKSRPKVVLVSDTPSLITDVASNISEFAEVMIKCHVSKHNLITLCTEDKFHV